MLTIKSIQVQVVNLAGQILYNQKSPYGSGTIDISKLPRGMYILTITSNDRKYQFIRKFTKG
jgi:Secretion system C-terminal sorting domain